MADRDVVLTAAEIDERDDLRVGMMDRDSFISFEEAEAIATRKVIAKRADRDVVRVWAVTSTLPPELSAYSSEARAKEYHRLTVSLKPREPLVEGVFVPLPVSDAMVARMYDARIGKGMYERMRVESPNAWRLNCADMRAWLNAALASDALPGGA